MDTYNKLRRATYYSDQKASREYTEQFLELAEKQKDSFNIALGHYYLGNSYVVDSDFETGLSFYLKSARYFERVNDSARLSSAYNGIGAAYENSGNDSLSLKYFMLSQSISKSLGDLRRSGIALNNIGNIYKHRGDIESARKYMELAVQDINTTGRLQYIHPLTLNLANTYVDLEEFEKASVLYEKVLKTVDTTQDSFSYGTALRGLGNADIAIDKPESGLEYLKRAYSEFKDAGFDDEALAVMPDLINAYELNEQYKAGLELSNRYRLLKDSIFTKEKDKNLSEALQKYEAEKKDSELKLLKIESEKKEQQRQLYLILALSGVLIAGLLGFFGYKNQIKNKRLASQKVLLEGALSEKNTLLKEIHHRVKNSFQIVSSLLYLQSENVEDKEAKLAIKEAENRVRSMILIHQKLYNRDELVGINTKEYIEDLATDIIESHMPNPESVRTSLQIEPLVLDLETITPLGLILSELITNVIKHAYKDIDDKLLKIKLKKEQNQLVLNVIDNGRGITKLPSANSFGITLMKALSKKLKAHLDFRKRDEEQGTVATLLINKFQVLS